MPALDRYQDRLLRIPPPGGNGCHPALLGVANLGIRAGLEPEVIHADIRGHIPFGGRRVPDREIRAAIHRALMDYQNGTTGTTYQTPPATVRDGRGTLERITKQARYTDEVELWECSPVGLFHGPEQDPALFLRTLFELEELLFIGARTADGIPGQNIRTTKQWVRFFEAGGTAGPQICTNPLSGQSAPKKSGDGETYRGDGCVRSFRYCLVEFDDLDFDTQIRFWSAVRLPVKALVFSGGKSIHGWVDLSALAPVRTAEEWTH